MSDTEQDDDCVSKKPWTEVLSRSLKLFTFHAAQEGGKSFGRVVFFVLLALLVLSLATYVVDSITGWFDFWPFNRSEAAGGSDARGWLNWGGDPTEPEVPAEDDVKWYCKWNPIC